MSERLRDGVEAALRELGSALLAHPQSEALRADLAGGRLDERGYYRELLHLVYRLLFLFVAEERKLPLSPSSRSAHCQAIYTHHHGATRLRDLCEKPLPEGPGSNLWRSLLRTFRLLRDADGAEQLGLSPRGGELFGPGACRHLEQASCDDRSLLRAIQHLSGFTDGGERHLINYADLAVEELGSVYESLLSYRPRVDLGLHSVLNPQSPVLPRFDLVAGSERKQTGSYYTPPELVRELIEQALAPVLERKLARAGTPAGREKAILGFRVCDPASGSGHFLLAAARWMARELARVRTGDDEPAPGAYLPALRDVIHHCIYAVDRDPLAVELCKMALWIEGDDAGVPLGFLDHHVKCGDSLVGLFDLSALEAGVVSRWGGERRMLKLACDLWTLGMLSPPPSLAESQADPIPARAEIQRHRAEPDMVPPGLASRVEALSRERLFFHWPLEFPDMFARGGFDVVLGNPPYSADLPATARGLVRATLSSARSNMNTAVAFLQRAHELLARGGRLGLVVPRSLTFSGEWEAIRRRLFDYVVVLVDAGQAFKGVKLEQILLSCGTTAVGRVQVDRLLPGGRSTTIMDKETWRSLGVWVTSVSDREARILERVKSLPRLGDLVRNYRGLGLQRSLDHEGELAVYGGAQVGVFTLLEERGRVSGMRLRGSERMLVPKVMAQNIVAHVKRPKPHAWIKAAIDWTGWAVPLDTVNCIVPRSEEISLIEIAALLNSRFASWYVTRFVFTDAHRTMHFDSRYMGNIPVPGFRSTTAAAEGGSLASAHHLLRQRLEKGDWPPEPRLVDGLIYRLLGMSDEERAEIDSFFSL